MANFWDLPKMVREKIYRLHLILDFKNDLYSNDISVDIFETHCGLTHTRRNEKTMPVLLQADSRIEKEAACVYFGENRSAFRNTDLDRWFKILFKRHVDQIRMVSLHFEHKIRPKEALATEKAFRKLATMQNLCNVRLEVSEQWMIEDLLKHDKLTMQWHSSLGYGPQVQLQILRINGMSELREMRGLQTVYVPIGDNYDPEDLSPDPEDLCYSETAMPGGLFSTIRREIMQPRDSES